MKNWNVRKTIVAREDMPEHHRLAQSLSWPHLVALGVGAIVGTGILTLIGVGAGKAGPAVILSFAIAGVICACAALAYAEVATMIPASGSAYTYSYVVFGELIAWMVGVALILEYTLVVSAVAVGWSGYAAGFLDSIGMGLAVRSDARAGAGRDHQPSGDLHHRRGRGPADCRHARERDAQCHPGGGEDCSRWRCSSRSLCRSSMPPHFEPFMPLGFAKSDRSGGKPRVGVMAAAAIIFFAFYGFDAIATAAEEAKNPAATWRSASSAR